MAHDYQTWQDDGSWYWPTIHKIARFFEHMIISSLVANNKHYISISTSPMDGKLDSVVSYDLGPKRRGRLYANFQPRLKFQLVKPSWNFISAKQ